MPLLWENVPDELLTLENVSDAGSESVTEMLLAVDGPLLVTTIV